MCEVRPLRLSCALLSALMIFIRLIRALYVFGIIFASYLVQLALARIFGKLPEGRSAILGRELPPWLAARRKRVDKKNAKRMLRDMLRLRGVFIKLGQVLSIMGGFLPRAYTKELEQLQDSVPPHPFSDLVDACKSSFGRGPNELFQSIDEEPLAAASLGQVHVAFLKDGRKVAVKFLYPRIREIVAVDMRVVRLAMRAYKWFVPVTKLERVHESLVDLLRRETDYLHEAACMERMAKNFANEEHIAFPAPVHDLTTKDVLVMTFMNGTKITKLDELRAQGIATHDVAVRLVQAFYKMLFLDRFFHADPHPGNFLVEKVEGAGFRVVVLDFGAACEAGDHLIDGLLDCVQGVFTGDDKLTMEGFFRMGFVAEGGNRELIEKTARTYFGKLLKIKDRTPAALMQKKPEELQQLADPEVERKELQDLMRSVEYPEDWFYVERASVMMFWLCAQIDPTLDTMAAGLPYVMPLVMAKQMARMQSAAT
ncbi:MAG: AarF/ABC1/UbiB kinase family protein [Polyangiaceae bacterium]|nr:AarF/ABC1/UbiB kinase family protein [Polyangiaceae bacterium]